MTVVLAAGARTPIGRFQGALAGVDPVDLGAHAVSAALERGGGLEPGYIAMGNVLQAANGQNPGRRAALQGGVGRTVPGITLNDVCLASMSALGLAASMLREGEASCVLVGGFDSMTRAPHAVRMRPSVRMGDQPLVDVMVHDGLYCSIADAGMGAMSDAENARLGISREAQDRFAARSHARALEGRSRLAEEIAPVGSFAVDEGARESSYETLAALPAAFTREGTITAGNASQVSDGGVAALVTTRERCASPLAEIAGRAVVAGPDSTLHLRPAEASAKLHARHGVAPADVDLWEINEAFAGVVLASVAALGIDLERVNVNGGAVALGHPLAASGLRLVLTLAFELRRRGGGLGVATLCGGGGQGEAVLYSRVTDLLVIGAGPYGLAVAREALRRGLSTTVVGRPMSFWREHMPAGMYLRSGPEWHLDPAEVLTLREFLASDEPDPLPIERFLSYADWFRAQARIEVRDEEVVRLDPGFVATLAGGETISARAVVAAPGVARFGVVPDWGAGLGEHTCDVVDFADMDGARVLIVGGRQSAYEWAALIGEHGAERIDVVHRHPEPKFDRVSWAFVEPHIESTLSTPGWWRTLPAAERDAIGRQFWEVGRLTLEHWLAPRLARLPVHRHAGAEVIAANGDGDVTLSSGIRLHADRVVFACGYRPDIARVPYLPPISASDGFPDLDPAFATSVPGLYIPGFPATRDFGPFFGFVRGAVPAARMIVRDIMRA